MASAQIIITPVRDSYNTHPEPLQFVVTDTTVSLHIEGAVGERVVTKKFKIELFDSLIRTGPSFYQRKEK